MYFIIIFLKIIKKLKDVYSFSKIEFRKEIGTLIDEAKNSDNRALKLLKELYKEL